MHRGRFVAGCLLAVVAAGCAHAPARPATVCPTAAVSWTPRPWPTTPADRKHPCKRPKPTPGVERVPFGDDLDEALACVERYYSGPDGLPIDAMLKSALDALVRTYPSARRAAVSAVLDDVDSIPSLTRTLLRVAGFARASVGPVYPPPEDVLVRGALSALAWQTELLSPRFRSRNEKPPESYTAVAKDFIVYIKVGDLKRGLAARFRTELGWHPVAGVILDLRGSTGGLFDETLAVIDLFLRNGCMIVTRPARDVSRAIARNQDLDVDAPLVVLVDHGTASGAELIAASVRANNRAVVIGDKTLGYGLLQILLQLSSGAMVKLTTAEMLAGDATPFHRRGLEPDVVLPASFEPGRSASDRGIDFAKQVLRGSSGAGRDALLSTARKLAAAAERR